MRLLGTELGPLQQYKLLTTDTSLQALALTSAHPVQASQIAKLQVSASRPNRLSFF